MRVLAGSIARWVFRGIVVAVAAVAALLLVRQGRQGAAALSAAADLDDDARITALTALIDRYPFSLAAQAARADLRARGQLPEVRGILSRYRANWALVLPAGLAALVAGIAALTDWEARRVPWLVSAAASCLAAGILVLGLAGGPGGGDLPAGAQRVFDRLPGRGVLWTAWALAVAGLCFVYFDKRRSSGGKLAPWQVERLLPRARTWRLLGLAAACAGWSLVALAGPIRVERWEVHAAVLAPLVAGAILGGKRGFLTMLVAATILATRVVPGAAVIRQVLGNPALAHVLALPAAALAVSAVLTGDRRRHIHRTGLALAAGVVALHAAALAAIILARGTPQLPDAEPVSLWSTVRSVVFVRLPGDVLLIPVATAMVALIGLPAASRARTQAQGVVLGRLEAQDESCELLILTSVDRLLAAEEQRFRERVGRFKELPLAARLTEEFTRLRQSVASRIFRLEQFLADREQAERDERCGAEQRVTLLEKEAAARPSDRVCADLAAARRALRELDERRHRRGQWVAEFEGRLTAAYARARRDEMLGLLRVFRPLVPPDTDETRPDIKAALDAVGRYFTAAHGPSGEAGEGSLGSRHDLAMRLKREMEADYRRRAEEVAALLKQAETFAADLKALRELWRAKAVTNTIWTAQQEAFARRLEETHRQIDLRRRILGIYRRAEPPLDLV